MNKLLQILLVLGMLIPGSVVSAQDSGDPIYIVQPGDTFIGIALQFGVSVDELAAANLTVNPNNLQIGNQLVIPGLVGVSGVLTTHTVQFGENLTILSRRNAISASQLAQVNHITSPSELYVGDYLILPAAAEDSPARQLVSLAPGQSMLELAVLQNTSTWSLAQENSLPASWSALPGEPLYTAAGSMSAEQSALHPNLTSIEISSLPLIQGATTVIKIGAKQAVELTGSLGEYELHFFPDGDHYVALQGIHAMAEPQLYPLSLRGTFADGSQFAYQQAVPVVSGGYINDLPLQVPPETIDPAVVDPELAYWFETAAPASPDRLWDGPFLIPTHLYRQDWCIETGECWTSRYGNRRSYNGSPYNLFHTGLDVAGGTGVEVFATAPGIVVLAEPLTVRGNAIMIDHGWGVYSAYMHLSQIDVQVGDRVEANQFIGLVGATGRVEGPHLHWEVIVGGVQVDPIDWMVNSVP